MEKQFDWLMTLLENRLLIREQREEETLLSSLAILSLHVQFLHSFKMIGLEETSLITSFIIISILYNCRRDHFFE